MGNPFTNMPTETQEALRATCNAKVSDALVEYTQTNQYLLDTIANTRDAKGKKIAQKTINCWANEVAETQIHLTDQQKKKVKNQFKYFVKTYTNVLKGRYNWTAINK